MDIPTRYDFQATEDRIYQIWLDRHCFDSVYDTEGTPRSADEAKKTPFTIVIPPPNITGRLHMGHALNNTVQDVLIRYKRMDGFDALWVPGTDHAGISTQTVVRKHLDADGIDYRELGREQFIERVWQWREKYGGVILNQLKKIGASCDWRRTRFTMDDGLSGAVRRVFKELFERDLIYRGYRIVNWCPVDRTALSDDEVDTKPEGEPGHLWHIRYPLTVPAGDTTHLSVATTRPETMFGDVAVAVHPEDERFRDLIGKTVTLPLQGREIPIIGDSYVDREFGTGCLKITPAHDPNDFEVGNRHGLEPINVMNEDATMNEVVPEAFRGLDRFKARQAALEALETSGLLEAVIEHRLPLGRAQRSGVPIEYRLSNQWFVKMKPLAEQALRASGYVRGEDGWEKADVGDLSFHPPRWEKVYFSWLDQIRDWTISRQIWWGHRIPAWHHRETGEIVVDSETPKQVQAAPDDWVQDPDVLDTWFSSWLWPMSTLGWPENTPDFTRYYPTTVLSTDKGIIFFWVARMNFAGLTMTDRLPYHHVYIHPTILDERGAVMSKSKGNGIDPLTVIEGATLETLKTPVHEARPRNAKELIKRIEKAFPDGFEAVGADALRFTLIYLCSDGQEIRLSLRKFNELGRRFITKLWNASRFVLLSLDKLPADGELAEPTVEDEWIRSRTESTIRHVRGALDHFNFAPMGHELYRFVWNDYCDWFVELTKGRMESGDVAAARRAGYVLGRTLVDVLRLLHPVTPFITEDLWSRVLESMDHKNLWQQDRPKSDLLILESYPNRTERADTGLEARFEALQRLVGAVRTARANARVAESVALRAWVQTDDDAFARLVRDSITVVERLANLDALELTDNRPEGSVSSVDTAFQLYLDLGQHIDLDAELSRIQKEMKQARKKLEQVSRKLENPKFMEGAKAEVIAEQKAKYTELNEILKRLERLKTEYGG